MANTRNDVAVTQGVWIDLFAGSGITVGTACSVINKGSNAFFVVIAPTAPAVPTSGTPKGMPCYPMGQYGSLINVATGASGLWAYCELNGGSITLVQE